jgi:tRNA(fMet)-specific endonuclease VapC
MFVVLDTNHFSELVRGSTRVLTLQSNITNRNADVFVTVITAQESFEGWFALINREKAVLDQTRAYAQFLRSIETVVKFTILPFDPDSARVFQRLRDDGIRIGTMDLKIASICIAHEATLLTRNRVDFDKVPGLRVENWLD